MERRKIQSKKSFSFSVDSKNEKAESFNAYNESITNMLKKSLGGGQENLEKTVRAQTVRREFKGYDKTKVVFSSHSAQRQNHNGLEQKDYRRLSDPEQREIAQVDPYISAIIANRCAQGATVGYESDSKFDKGSRVNDKNPPQLSDFETEEEYKKACIQHEARQKAIMNWILKCGTSDQEIINSAFANADLTFKHCSLREFLEAQVRNLLTFGRCATQIYRNEDGVPVMFRPLPVETIQPVTFGESPYLSEGENTMEQSKQDLVAYEQINPAERPIAYAQVVDGNAVNFFTEDDLHMWYWQKQALFDLRGYPLGPIEQAIYMVFVHQQTLNYLRNQFIKGMGNKGLITMESTQEGVEISEADMENFRQQFHNFVTRNDNSAVTPVIGGPIRVNYIPLSSTPRDMEFLQVEEHVIRALCSAFQISPQEMGYGHLGLPSGQLGGANNRQEDVIRGEERGLRMLLDIIYDGLNKIIFENFPEAENKFILTYLGVGEDTRDAVIQRQQAELNTTATMNSLYADSEKTELIHFGGDVPLSSAFHGNVVRYMKFGEVREYLFKEKGAKENPIYDFVVDPNLNQTYQQLKVQSIADQKKAAEMQLQEQAIQVEGAGQQLQQQEQMMQMQEMQMQQGVAPEGEQPQQEEPAPEEAEQTEKSMTLMDRWIEKNKLRKSYFSGWLDVHKNEN